MQLRNILKTAAVIAYGFLATSISPAPAKTNPHVIASQEVMELEPRQHRTYNLAPWNTDVGTIQRCAPKKDYITHLAKSYGVNPEYFFGMVVKESLCDALIVHPAGAAGILQTKWLRAQMMGWQTVPGENGWLHKEVNKWINQDNAIRFMHLAQATNNNSVHASLYDDRASWQLQIATYAKLGHGRSFRQLVREHYNPSAPTEQINREYWRSIRGYRHYKNLVASKWEIAADDFEKRNNGLQLEDMIDHERSTYRQNNYHPLAPVTQAENLVPAL